MVNGFDIYDSEQIDEAVKIIQRLRWSGTRLARVGSVLHDPLTNSHVPVQLLPESQTIGPSLDITGFASGESLFIKPLSHAPAGPSIITHYNETLLNGPMEPSIGSRYFEPLLSNQDRKGKSILKAPGNPSPVRDRKGKPILKAPGNPSTVRDRKGKPILKAPGNPSTVRDMKGKPILRAPESQLLSSSPSIVQDWKGKPILRAPGSQLLSSSPSIVQDWKGKPILRAPGSQLLSSSPSIVQDWKGKPILRAPGSQLLSSSPSIVQDWKGKPILRAPGSQLLSSSPSIVQDWKGKPILRAPGNPSTVRDMKEKSVRFDLDDGNEQPHVVQESEGEEPESEDGGVSTIPLPDFESFKLKTEKIEEGKFYTLIPSGTSETSNLLQSSPYSPTTELQRSSQSCPNGKDAQMSRSRASEQQEPFQDDSLQQKPEKSQRIALKNYIESRSSSRKRELDGGKSANSSVENAPEICSESM
ncbi:hypothetical protein NHQ30_009442 [Ciborinia camelliae]|nr:hypothetical protein NHQ30_009442 [Ciborinia camelliae]